MWKYLLAVLSAGVVSWGVSATGTAQDAEQPADAPASIDYLKQIKPLLRERCFTCHGALKQEGGLRLDTVSLMLKGGDSGPALERKHATASLLLLRVTASSADERMPPENDGVPFTEEEVSLLRRWIDAGALAPLNEEPEADPKDHWAFQPVVRPDVPATNSPWIRNPIDAFIAGGHERHRLIPQPEAARIVLLRRLYLDLLGVPPSLNEIEAFERDPSSQAYEQTVQRLLDDPRHGERWARHWMDIWRYSDWWGLGQQLRNSQKHIWHWRDWIIESLNNDTGYDEMVRLMLAADELHPNDLDKLRATGFLARNYFLFNRPQWMEESVEHISKGFLGLTMNCTRCHEHKYDPFQQADFYRFRAFLEPYHVRLDMVPGEPDFERDGVPRVYDGFPDDPTYVYVRGDEKNPDKSRAVSPGVPELLAFKELLIEPVSLPVEAWQPELRPWVAEAHLAAARKKVETAQAALKAATEKVAVAEKNASDAAAQAKAVTKEDTKDDASPLVVEKFATLDETRWKLYGEGWSHSPGKLEQKRDGAQRSTLRLIAKPPRDFDATVRFTILGGSQWRSVGLSFDASELDPTRDTSPDYSEQNVYVSAYAGGPKIHAAYNERGKWHYPPGHAVRQLPIELNREYTLQVQVRGQLINATLNGEPVLACETPLARADGHLQVTAFDALTVLHEIKVAPLSRDVKLRTPGNAPQSPQNAEQKLALARAEHAIAEADLAIAQASVTSVERRAAAMQFAHQQADSPESKTAHAEAVRAERLVAVELARRTVAVAERDLLQAAADKRDAVEKTLNAAREAFDKAVSTSQSEVKETDQFTRLTGAQWTATRFFSSGKDDPFPEFKPTSTGRRTALADWITDRRNPLTARVAANHIWMRHMGRPLVATVFDFGRNGAAPTHPELLDWLASELMDNGWSMKHLHRLITNSAAYRLSSSLADGEQNVERDPENRYWWRRVPIRVESQVVRDSLLSMAGTLDEKIGGPTVPRAEQDQSTRRSLYFFHSNNERNLFLTTFDEALVKDCYRREQSIVPQQALALSNSSLATDSAGKIAVRLSPAAKTEANFVRAAFAVVTGIRPSDDEAAASAAALAEWRKLPGGSDEQARANLVWALINHNDFVTLR